MDRKAQLEQLLAACEQGDAARVTRLLSADGAPEVDALSDDGTTPLQAAAASGCEETVRALLVRGAALDTANPLGWTPLLHACRHGHAGVVALLLQRGAALRARTRLGVDALVLAVRGGHTQTARLLLDAGAGGNSMPVGVPPEVGLGPGGGCVCDLTALSIAALTGHDPLVRLLTDRGWDAGERAASTGTTPLMCSAMNGHVMTAQALVERGCDPNVEDVNGKTALQLAVEQGKREVRGFLDRKTANKSKAGHEMPKLDIIEATKKGDIARIREILEENDTHKDFSLPQDGVTPLMYAAMSGRIDIAVLLVERGCDVNKQDNVSDRTSLMQAVYYGKKAMVKFLVGAGADVSLREKTGMTAFDMATFRDDGDKELVRLLAAKSARASTLPSRRETAALKVRIETGASAGQISEASDHRSSQGWKSWWSRVSNKFRNLKLTTRSSSMPTTSRLSTLADAVNTSPSKNGFGRQKKGALNSSVLEVGGSGTETPAALSSAISAALLLDSRKRSASMHALVAAQHSTTSSAFDLKDKKGRQGAAEPFRPLPSFETFNGSMPAMRRKSTSTFDLSMAQAQKHPMEKSSTLARRAVGAVPSSGSGVEDAVGVGSNGERSATGGGNGVAVAVSCSSPSPDSSGGASSISTLFSSPGNGSYGTGGKASSATSSTLTPGGGSAHSLSAVGHQYHDRFPKRISSMDYQSPVRPPSFLVGQQYRGNSLTRGGLTPQLGLLSTGWACSSSTMLAQHAALVKRPSPSYVVSPTLVPMQEQQSSSSMVLVKDLVNGGDDASSMLPVATSQQDGSTAETDEFSKLLKKLSLEKYREVFDKEEVDMDAFLDLTDADLSSLGICHADSRRQILSAISELKSTSGSH